MLGIISLYIFTQLYFFPQWILGSLKKDLFKKMKRNKDHGKGNYRYDHFNVAID